MDIQFYGANCVKISGKKFSIVVDDNLAELGQKTVVKPTDIVLATNQRISKHEAHFSIDSPGEYELSGVSITGVGARAHTDEEVNKSATIYKIEAEDSNVVITGHVYPDLSDEQLEKIGRVDVLIVPVGGLGYTLDGVGALKLIKDIEPKIVIPTHFADKSLKYEVAQTELSEALKALGMEPAETLDRLKPKSLELSDSTKLVILNKQ